MKQPLLTPKSITLVFFYCVFSWAQLQATNYYARTSGNWNAASTWTTSAYNNNCALLFPSVPAGGAGVPTINDNVYIAAGFTVTINSAGAVCNDLIIGNGFYFYGLTCLLGTTTPSTGTLVFASTGNYDLTIKRDLITYAAGSGLGTFQYTGNASRTHTVSIGRNFTNGGVTDFWADADDVVNLTFDNNNATVTNSVIAAMPAAGSDFNKVIMNKASKTIYVQNQSTSFTNYISARTAASGCQVKFVQGTYIHDNTGDLNWLDNNIQSGSYSLSAPYRAGNDGFDIDANVVVEVPMGIVRLGKPSSVAADALVIIEGKLYVDGGTVYACPTSASSTDLTYASSGTANTPELTITSGTLYSYGAFTGTNSASALDQVWFNMSGGSMYVLYGASSASTFSPFEVKNVAGSTFTMSGGNIYINKTTATPGRPDLNIGGDNLVVNVTGGTMNFGNAGTAYSYTFVSNAAISHPHMKVNGLSGTQLQPMDLYGSSDYSFLSLYIAASNTFEVYNTASASTNMTLTSAYSGTNAFYLDGIYRPRSGTVTFNSGGTQSMATSNGSTFPFYSLVNASSNTLVGASSISMKKDWTNNGTYTQGTGTVTFDGTVVQYIGGANSTTFYNLTVNKTAAANLVLNINTSVGDDGGLNYSGALTLSNGTLELNARNLTITDGSSSGITRTNGYVMSETYPSTPGGGTSPSGPGYGYVTWNVGILTAGNHTVPFVTSAGSYIPFTFGGLSVGLGNVYVATYHTTPANSPFPSGVNHTSDYTATSVDNSSKTVDRFWVIGKTGASGTATLTFTYTASEAPAAGNVGTDGVGSKAQRYYNNLWQPFTAGQTPNTALTYTVTAANISQFAGAGTGAGNSPWALSLSISPLPIELLDFTAKFNSDYTKVNLAWATATEKNNDYFAVESSSDGETFEPVLYRNGAGNSSQLIKYFATDDEPFEGNTYYRLKQYDYNGAFTYSKVVLVQKEAAAPKLSIYPNPVAEYATIELYTENSNNLQVTLEDLTGKILVNRQVISNPHQTNKISLDLKNLVNGVYNVSVRSEKDLLKSKIIKL